ncbi:MAG: cell division protein FtsL [Deltaproteobacteria bacterium]|nr:cell division protein FtsL [Deltaproteobacteria bacterium]
MQNSSHWVRYTLLALVGLVLALAQVWTRLQVVAVGYTLSNARQLVHTLQGERQELEAQWSASTTPSRLGEQATQRLGLSAPQPEQVLRVQ